MCMWARLEELIVLLTPFLLGKQDTKVIPAFNTGQHFGSWLSFRCSTQTFLLPFNWPNFQPSTTSVHFASILWHQVCNTSFQSIPFKIWCCILKLLLGRDQRNTLHVIWEEMAFSLLLLQSRSTTYWDFESQFRQCHLVILVQLTPGLVCFQIPVYMTEHLA